MRFIRTLLLGFLLFLGEVATLSCSLWGQNSSTLDLERLDSLLQEGKLQDARKILQEIQTTFEGKSKDPLLLREVALLCRLGKPFEAKERFIELSSQSRKRAEVQVLEALICYNTYAFDEARALAETLSKNRRGKLPKVPLKTVETMSIRAKQLLGNSIYLNVVDSFAIADLADLRHNTGLSKEIGSLYFNSGKKLHPFTFRTSLGFETFSTHISGDSLSHISYRKTTADGELIEERELTELHLPGGEYFPVLSQDGSEIYFASPSHPMDYTIFNEGQLPYSEGIGGFDLYVARRNLETGSFQAPILLGMPYNSPSDDLILLFDDIYQRGLLVSTRFAPEGGYNCYIFEITEAPLPPPTNDEEAKKAFAMLFPWQGLH